MFPLGTQYSSIMRFICLGQDVRLWDDFWFCPGLLGWKLQRQSNLAEQLCPDWVLIEKMKRLSCFLSLCFCYVSLSLNASLCLCCLPYLIEKSLAIAVSLFSVFVYSVLIFPSLSDSVFFSVLLTYTHHQIRGERIAVQLPERHSFIFIM